jgi:hypothetical protein
MYVLNQNDINLLGMSKVLTFESLAITLCATYTDIQKFYIALMCFVWTSEQRLLPHTTVTIWFCVKGGGKCLLHGAC